MRKLLVVTLLVVAALLLTACDQEPRVVVYQESYSQYQARIAVERAAWENQQRINRLNNPTYIIVPYRPPTYSRHYSAPRRPARQSGRVPVTVVKRPTRQTPPTTFSRPTGTGPSSRPVIARTPSTNVYRPSTARTSRPSTTWSRTSSTRSTSRSRSYRRR